MLTKGLSRDLDAINQPKATSPYIVNGNLTDEFGSVTNERSTELFSTLPDTNSVLLGEINLDNEDKVIFTTNGISLDRISVLNADGTINTIIGPLNLDFTKANQIEAQFKVNNKGERIVYWTDNINPPRWLNIDNPQTPNDLSINIDALRIFPIYSNNVPIVTEVTTGGSLGSGVYYFTINYVDTNNNETNYQSFSNPVPITSSTITVPYYNKDGDAPNTPTSKAITLTIPVDTIATTKYFKIGIVYKHDGVLSAYETDTFLQTGTSVDIQITTLDNLSQVEITKLLTTSAFYKTAKTISQLENVLYMANLKDLEDINLQPYVNGIIVDYVTDQIDATTAYRDPVFVVEDKSFMWDETYALYASFLIGPEEKETQAFHIPGRPPFPLNMTGEPVPRFENLSVTNLTSVNNFNGGSINDVTPGGQLYYVNNNARIFHAFDAADNVLVNNIYGITGLKSNMGYWENINEKYSNSDDWLVKNSSDVTIGNLKNTSVRHHKFPHAQDALNKMMINQTASSDYNQVNILGIKLKNISIPSRYNITGIKLYYAKRDINNRTILGQALTIPNLGYHVQVGDTWSRSQILNGPGQFFGYAIWREASQKGDADYEYALVPSFNMNSSADPLNRFYANRTATTFLNNPAPNVLGYYNFNAFDILHNNLAVEGSSYIKNIFKLGNNYTKHWDYGDSDANWHDPDTGTFHPTNYGVGILWDPVTDPSDYLGITSVNRKDRIRNLRTKNYIPYNYPETLDFVPPTFNSYMNPYNGRGEVRLLLEYNNELQDMSFADYAEINFVDKTAVNTGFNPGGKRGANIYLSNLCQFKEDIYNSFDNQELCFIGKNYTIADVLTTDIYAGDTFINVFSFQSQIDLGQLAANAGEQRQHFEIRCLYNYICQSDANISLRYSVIGDVNKNYYPKIAAAEKLSSFVDQWLGYNNDYSSLNDISTIITYYEQNNIANSNIFKNRVIRSNKDNLEGAQDGYRQFLANNYVDLDRQRGQIEKLVRSGDSLLIHLTKSLTRTIAREVLKTDSATAYLGTGDIFEIPAKDILYTDIGYGGTSSQWANIVTPFGYIYPDISTRKVYSVGGEIDEISSNGMIQYFRDNLRMILAEQLKTTYNYNLQYTDNPVNPNGYGFTATWDTTFRRYVITKIDYEMRGHVLVAFKGTYNPLGVYNNGDVVYYPETGKFGRYNNFISNFVNIALTDNNYFIDKSFTLSYYPEFKAWGSFYDYKPRLYFADSKDLFAFYNEKIYKHNSKLGFGDFYDLGIKPFTIDVVYNQIPSESKIFSSVSYISKYESLNGTNIPIITFDEFMMYNSYQTSGFIDLINLDTARLVNSNWNINQFRNLRSDYGSPILDNDYNYTAITDPNMTWYERERMSDNYMVARLQFNNVNQGLLAFQFSDSFEEEKVR